jgi:hypothetical protein
MSDNVIFGEKEEQRLKPILSSYFDRKLYSTDKYSIFDFHCGKKFIYIELKSLRHCANKYSTTMIGYNKIEEAVRKRKLGCRIFLVFNFVDCIRYIEICDNFLSNTNWIKPFNKKQYIYIPVKFLDTLTEGDILFLPELD